jgi:hypothetical protein
MIDANVGQRASISCRGSGKLEGAQARLSAKSRCFFLNRPKEENNMLIALGTGSVRSKKITSEQRKILIASSLGTIFEWYDFILFGSLAPIIAANWGAGPGEHPLMNPQHRARHRAPYLQAGQ